MAWTNIFDLGEWDVYIQFYDSVTHTPDIGGFLVKMEDVPASFGTVTVVDGAVVIDSNNGGTATPAPLVVVMPRGFTPAQARARVTSEADFGGGYAPQEAGGGASFAAEAVEVVDVGSSQYTVTYGDAGISIPDTTEITQIELDGEISAGNGIGLQVGLGGG